MKGSEEEAGAQERLWHMSELGSGMENGRKEGDSEIFILPMCWVLLLLDNGKLTSADNPSIQAACEIAAYTL